MPKKRKKEKRSRISNINAKVTPTGQQFRYFLIILTAAILGWVFGSTFLAR